MNNVYIAMGHLIRKYKGAILYKLFTVASSLLLASLLLVACPMVVQAQQMDWVRGMGGNNSILPSDVVTDALGNVYTVGTFDDVIDFDPGDGQYQLTAFEPQGITQRGDVFVSKLDAQGHFVWAKQLGGNYKDAGIAVKVDDEGNIYVAGNFNTFGPAGGQMDADPGTGVADTFFLYGKGGFLVKLDNDGDFIWARQLPDVATVTSMDMDAMGNTFVIGTFSGTGDFDFGIGIADTFLLTATDAQSCFIVGIDSEGQFIWAKAVASHAYATSDPMPLIALGANGSIYVTGLMMPPAFGGAIPDFDPGTGVFEMSAASLYEQYIYKLDNSGNFIWANKTTGPAVDIYEFMTPYDMALDEEDNIYTVGRFNANYDFDPGTGVADTFYLDGAIETDENGRSYILKLDSTGNLGWARMANDDGGGWSRVGAKGRSVYLSGSFVDSMDVDFGEGHQWLYNLSDNINPAPGNNGVLLKLDASDGSVSWTAQHASNEEGLRPGYIWVDHNNNCYVAGSFTYVATFDATGNPTNLFALNASSIGDMYVLKYSCNSYVILDTTACLSFSFNGTEYTESGIYEVILGNEAQCDSIITLNLTLQEFDTAVIQEGDALVAQASGLSYQWLDCINDMELVAGATEQSFTPPGPGQYALALTSGECSYTTACINYEGTGIKAVGDAGMSQVHPNPATDVLHIEVSKSLREATISITDMAGRVIMQQEGMSGSRFNADVRSLAPGVYSLTISDRQLRYIVKWVKQ